MSYRTSLYSSTKLLIFLWGVHQYINCCGEGDVNKAGRKFLMDWEGTFPSAKIFPSQKGQPLKFSKPLIIFFIFLLSHDERKLEGVGKKKILPLKREELFSGGCLFWEMPDSWGALVLLISRMPNSPGGIISSTLSFNHPLGLYYWLFPSGYNCSYKLSLTCMNECMKEKGNLTLLTCLCR